MQSSANMQVSPNTTAPNRNVSPQSLSNVPYNVRRYPQPQQSQQQQSQVRRSNSQQNQNQNQNQNDTGLFGRRRGR